MVSVRLNHFYLVNNRAYNSNTKPYLVKIYISFKRKDVNYLYKDNNLTMASLPFIQIGFEKKAWQDETVVSQSGHIKLKVIKCN